MIAFNKFTVNTDIKSKKKILETINCITFSDFLMFHQTFLSPQVKRSSIITYKHGKYEFPNELLNT